MGREGLQRLKALVPLVAVRNTDVQVRKMKKPRDATQNLGVQHNPGRKKEYPLHDSDPVSKHGNEYSR